MARLAPMTFAPLVFIFMVGAAFFAVGRLYVTRRRYRRLLATRAALKDGALRNYGYQPTCRLRAKRSRMNMNSSRPSPVTLISPRPFLRAALIHRNAAALARFAFGVRENCQVHRDRRHQDQALCRSDGGNRASGFRLRSKRRACAHVPKSFSLMLSVIPSSSPRR